MAEGAEDVELGERDAWGIPYHPLQPPEWSTLYPGVYSGLLVYWSILAGRK